MSKDLFTAKHRVTPGSEILAIVCFMKNANAFYNTSHTGDACQDSSKHAQSQLYTPCSILGAAEVWPRAIAGVSTCSMQGRYHVTALKTWDPTQSAITVHHRSMPQVHPGAASTSSNTHLQTQHATVYRIKKVPWMKLAYAEGGCDIMAHSVQAAWHRSSAVCAKPGA